MEGFIHGADLDRQIDAFYGHVGRRLREVRTSAHLTQAQLAKAVDMTRSSIANLEAGRQRVPLHLLIWIAEIVDVRPADLLPDAPAFGGRIAAPDLTSHLVIDNERMRSFVESTIAKVTTSSKEA